MPNISLTWTRPALEGDEICTYCYSYRVEFSADGSTWEEIEDDHILTSTAISSWQHEMSWGVTYLVRVAATGGYSSVSYGNGMGPWTQVSVFTSREPDAPTGTEACRIGDTDDYQISWNAPSDDGGSPITSYTLKWGFSEVTATSSPHIITRGGWASVSVYANNANGQSSSDYVFLSQYSTDACPGTTPTTTTTTTTTTTAPPTTTTATTTTTVAPTTTASESVGERNARQSAADYLAYSSFSRSGLIGQLEYEGFTTAQAEYGATAVGL